MLAIAVILVIISLAIIIATGRARGDSRTNTLLASGAMIGLTIVILVVIFILIRFYVTRRLQGKDSNGLKITIIVMVVIFFLLTIIGSIMAFVSANQIEEAEPDNKDEPRNLRGAAAISVVGSVLTAISISITAGFIISKIPKQYRKTVVRGALASNNDDLFNVGVNGAFEQLQRRR